MAATDQQIQQLAEALTRALEDMNRVVPNVASGMNAMGEAAPGITKGGVAMTLAADAANKMAKGMYDSAKAMYEGQKGLKAFDSAVDGTADALMVLTGALALIGGPITLLAAGLTAAVAAGAKYVKATNEQSDKLYDAFQQMSRSGGAAADGLQGLYNDVQKLGGGIQDLGDFVNLIASSSKDLATFGGSVFEGRKEFARLGKEMEPFRAALMNSGMTQKEINEASMGYLRLQSRIGATQNKTTAELADSTRKYLIEQDALTKLTGMTRKEQEDARDAIRSQEVFAGKLLQLRNRGADQAAKQLEDTFLVLQKDSKEVGQGFADISSGNLRTEAAQKLMRATQGEAMRVQQELSEGQITAAQAADRISQALGRNIEMYGETQSVLGNYNSTFGDVSGQITIASRQLTGGYEKQLAAIDKNSKQMGITGDKALDAELQRQTDLRLTQQKAMQNMQDFVRLGVGPATEATSFFGKVIERITNLLPGSGKFAKEYEQEKKAREALLTKEKAVQDQSQAIMDIKSRLDAEQDEEKKKIIQQELDAAKIKFATAVKERDLLKSQPAGYTEKPKTAAETATAKQTSQAREASESAKQRVDVLAKQLDEDEKALKDAKRSGKYGDDIKVLEDKIRANKEEYEKATKELLDAEKKIKAAALEERQVRLKQMQDRRLLTRLENENVRDTEDIAKLNEQRADLYKQTQSTDVKVKQAAEKSLAKIEQQIEAKKQSISGRSGEVAKLKQSLGAQTGTEPRDSKPTVPSPAEKAATEASAAAAAAQKELEAARADPKRKYNTMEMQRLQADARRKKAVADEAASKVAPTGGGTSAAPAAPTGGSTKAPAAPTGTAPSSGPTAEKTNTASTASTDPKVSSPEQAGTVPNTDSVAKPTMANDSAIVKVVDSKPGQISVENSDGTTTKRVGAANWRMNNPGNLRLTNWVKQQGGVVGEGDAGPSGKFAVFSTLEAGRKAKENLLFSGNTVYGNLDLRQAMYKYAPPSENPTESYLESVLKATGATDSTKLSELSQSQRDAMLAQIEKVEGFKPGKIFAAADGGIVREKLGGTLIQAGEAGQDEAVVPLKNGAIPVTLNGNKEIVDALKTMSDEFKSAIAQMTQYIQQNQSAAINEQTLEVLRNIESATKDSTSIQDKLLRVAQN